MPNVCPATLHDLQLHLTVRVGWGGVGIIPNVSGLQLHLMVRVGWGGVGIIPNVSKKKVGLSTLEIRKQLP